MAAKLKKGDKVVVIAGKDKGRQGEITRVIPADNNAVVDGVNDAIRHTKQSAQGHGGRIAKAMPIQLSNLALIDPRSDRPARVGFRLLEDGKKVRVAKGSGEVLDA